MIGFLDRYEGGALNIDAIRHIGPGRKVEAPWGEERRHRVFFKGDEHFSDIELTKGALRQLLERPVQLLPAEAGSRLLSVGIDGGEYYCQSTALIAWALCLDGDIRPVTPAGVDDGGCTPTDGIWWVELPTGGIYDNGPDATVVVDRAELEALIRRRAEAAA